MERITLRVRTKKKEGTVPLMFRLRDTNCVDIYYKSDIAAVRLGENGFFDFVPDRI